MNSPSSVGSVPLMAAFMSCNLTSLDRHRLGFTAALEAVTAAWISASRCPRIRFPSRLSVDRSLSSASCVGRPLRNGGHGVDDGRELDGLTAKTASW